MSKVTKEMINAAHDVTMQSELMLGHELLTKIYLAMDAQRQWIGLTDDDLIDCESEEDVLFVRRIEAKLKEKNT